MCMIGRLRSVVLDTRDPHKLADFYAEVLGATMVSDEPDWVAIADESGRRLAFQTAPEYEPPRFPDLHGSQQLHLDILVDDIERAEQQVLALGATRVPDAPEEDSFRVYRDPAGHTFCLLWGVAEV
jgi:catechol 2,3-dioxygenase-like lactoylglutathione lyase family enzyme